MYYKKLLRRLARLISCPTRQRPRQRIGRQRAPAGSGGMGLAGGGPAGHPDHLFHLLQPCRALRILQFKVNQQIGIPLLLAALAALVGEVKLASNNRRADQSAREREARERKRAANEADRERDRAAEEREQTARRARIQARFLAAQCRFLLADTTRNRLQLNERWRCCWRISAGGGMSRREPKGSYACTIKSCFAGWPG